MGGIFQRSAHPTPARARWRARRATSPAIQRAPAVAKWGGEEEVVWGYVILFRIRATDDTMDSCENQYVQKRV